MQTTFLKKWINFWNKGRSHEGDMNVKVDDFFSVKT